MHKYVARRLLIGIPTLVGITMIIFLALRVMPGDVLAAMFGGEEGMTRISDQERQRALELLGLDRPLYVQYAVWIKDLAYGRLGESFFRGDDVSKLLARRAPITAEMAVFAVVLSWLVGVPVGILSALRQDTLPDYVARVATIFFVAAPGFWLGALYVLVLVMGFGWLPPPVTVQIWENPVQNLQQVIGPSIVLGLGMAAFIARMTRSSVLEIVREDYVRTARSKGLGEWTIMSRHVLRNAMFPVVTASGLALGALLGGSVAVEKATNVQGLGQALVRATTERDFAVVQSLVLLYGAVFLLTNLLVDLAYAWFDPRIRYE